VKLELSKLASGYELLGVLLAAFGLNIIPFAGPSNLLIASSAALAVDADPFTLGFLVALGSATAKFIHYLITFFLGRFLSEERRKRLDVASLKIRRWAFLALFVAAATPIPDEPVVIPLGLLKYNPVKFYLAFFLGKLSITTVGAYFGRLGQAALLSVTSQEVLMALSIILTIVVTVVLLKVDVGKIAEKVLKKVKGV
jgi:membrane protein DedA with SNARE-associated domain